MVYFQNFLQAIALQGHVLELKQRNSFKQNTTAETAKLMSTPLLLSQHRPVTSAVNPSLPLQYSNK